MKAVIFDMDGVISDTQSMAAEVESRIFKKYGLEITPKYCTEVYAGTSHKEMYSKEFKEAGIKIDVDEVVKETWNVLLNSKELVKPIEGIHELISMLKEHDYTIAVASGSIPEFIDMVLDALHIKDQFSVIVSASQVKNGKPAPDIFLLAAKVLGVKPSECIVIEDGINGMHAAKSAGMRCIGLVNDTREYPADVIVTSLKELKIQNFM